MNRNIRHFVTAAVLASTVFGGALTAHAQDNSILGQPVQSLDFQRTDVRDALKALFRQVPNANYAISQDVQGTVEGRLTNTTFEQALLFILRQVQATYRLEAGVFQIIPRESTTGPTPTGNETGPTTTTQNRVTRRIRLRSADPQLIAILIGSDRGSQNFLQTPETSAVNALGQGGMGGMGGGMGGMMGGMGGGMGGMMGGMGGMGGGMGGMGGGMMGGMGGGMGGMGGGFGGGMGGMGGGGFGR